MESQLQQDLPAKIQGGAEIGAVPGQTVGDGLVNEGVRSRGPFTVSPSYKILYLFSVSTAALASGSIHVSLTLLCLQILIWIFTGIKRADFKVFKNAFGFSLTIIFFESFFSTPRDFVLLTLADFPLSVSTQGFFGSLVSVVRFVTILMTSLVVRKNMSSEDFVTGLVGLKISKNFAQVLDGILSSLEGKGGQKNRGQGGGQGKGAGGNKGESAAGQFPVYSIKGILRGEFHFLTRMIQNRLAEAKEKIADQDWAVISGVAIIMVSLRLIKVLPGLPFAPGHKNVLIVPLFILVASLSRKRFSATYVGILSGIINFLFGYGKYGALGILQFAVPGLVVDLTIGLTRFSRSIFVFALIGFCAGFGRASVELLIAVVFGLPKAFYAFLGPLLLTQCGFGALSAPVSKFLFSHFHNPDPTEPKGNL